ncbi:MAG: hypothetical protein CME06_13700 [Gemmatimonadetes bacterium]|nr:hypothetical protein [Gemmatimonadota bacterium]
MIELPPPEWSGLLPALYAEVHYRHGRLPSLLYRPFPEVVIDVPIRLEPGWEGDRLPVLLLIKDAHRYPVTIESIKIDLRAPRGRRFGTMIPLEWACREPMQHKIFYVDLGPLARRGELAVAGEVRLREDGGRRRSRRVRIRGDSYGRWPTMLATRAAADPYPSKPGWVGGDLHHHTAYTADQVEFGAPLEVSAVFAAAAGCGWAATTDHSYDLDDDPADFLRNRPDLPKWRSLREEARRLNAAGAGAWLLPGEEVSCGGVDGHNLHLLVLGHESFLPGVGDGGERWFHNAATFPLTEVLRRIESGPGIAYAAHPFEPMGRLNRFAFNRSTWSDEDVRARGLHGLQLWNRANPDALRIGLERWKTFLARGLRRPIAAGNDAHGSFALGRSIALPFLSLSWGKEQIYANARTLLRIRESLGDGSLLDALAAGRSSVTNGPFLSLEALQADAIFESGDRIAPDRPATIRARGRSTAEFGRPSSLVVHLGMEGRGERVAAAATGDGCGEIRAEFLLEPIPARGWIRAELRCGNPEGSCERGLALANPIYF